MKKLISLALLLFFISQEMFIHASASPLTDQQVQHLLDHAQFLAQQGVCKSEILRIFKKSLSLEELCTTNLEESKSSSPNAKEFLIFSGVFIIIVGAAVIYTMKCKANKKAHRQQLVQNVTNLDRQVTLAQARLDEMRNQNQPMAAEPANNPRHLIQADIDAQRDTLQELILLQVRATTARNTLLEYDREQEREKEARNRECRKYEAKRRQEQLDRIETMLRDR